MDILSLDRICVERAARCFIVAAFGFSAHAAQLDTTADAVLGQAGFTTNASGTSATTLNGPRGIASDAITGRLFVSDSGNNRVMSWPSSTAFSNGQAADLVFGQANFTSGSSACSSTGMNHPIGVAVDQFGNVYIADSGNHRILFFKPPLSSGMAGVALLGQADATSCVANRGGPVSERTLSSPAGIVLDTTGQLYVADVGNNRVIGFGVVARFGQNPPSLPQIFGQGGWTESFPNRGGAVAAFTVSSPSSVAVDPVGGRVGLDGPSYPGTGGSLWVTDSANNRTLRYEFKAPYASGGNGDRVLGQPDFATSTAPSSIDASNVSNPQAMAIDTFGAVYVADPGRNRILRYTTLDNGAGATAVFGQSGSFTTGAASTTADGLFNPAGLAVDASGNLFVADRGNNRVLRFDQPLAHGVPNLLNISPRSVPAGGVALVVAVNGTGFVANSTVTVNGSERPTQFLSDKRLVAQIPATDLASGGPASVAVVTAGPGGGSSMPIAFIFYARTTLDASADRALGISNFVNDTWGGPVGEEQLGDISSARLGSNFVAIDPVSGRMFVAVYGHHRILSWPSASSFANASSPDVILGQPNEYSIEPNTGGISAASLNLPHGPAVDAHGALYVPDLGNNRVLQYLPPFTTGMAASRVFGQGGSFTTVNYNGPSADTFSGPRGLTVSDSALFVADYRRILVFVDPYGDTTADVVIGQAHFTTNDASPVSATSLSGNYGIYGISIDREGRLLVPDASNNRVLRFSPPFSNGMAADLVIGQPDFTSSDRRSDTAGLNAPYVAASDRGGNLLVADSTNQRVLHYRAPLTNGMAASGMLGGIANVARSSLSYPISLALDRLDNVYVSISDKLFAFDRPFPTPLPKSDTTGNGKSDLVWRASDGGFAVWDMNGGTLNGFSYGIVGTEWQVVGTGDFNGDGKADLFWRRAADGATYAWLMDGTHPVSFVDTGIVPLDFNPVAVADFDGDGYADVLFRRSNGQVYLWLMKNGAITSQGFFGGSVPLEWTVQGTGDLDGDGRADIVWRNSTTHETWVWTMNGLSVLASARVSPDFDATWQLGGIADFDGDGKDDLQWRRNDGNNFVLLMNGATTKDYIDQADIGPEWVIQGFGDFNGDGKADIVWRHATTGDVAIWLMQVNAPTASFSLGNPGSIWSVAAPKR